MKFRLLPAYLRGSVGLLLLLLLLLLLACGTGVSQAAAVRTYVTEIPELLARSPASDWERIPDGDIVLLELASGTVVVELAPFASPGHAGRWRSLVRDGYYDDSSVQRVQENYVVQWGEATGTRSPGEAGARLPDETRFAFTPSMEKAFVPLGAVDGYAPHVGFIDGFPVGVDEAREHAWVLHCHGAVGTVQADPASTPGGVYFYAAIGNPARELDGRIPVVGRVIEGIEAMSTLPRGEGVYGFLDASRHVPIQRTRLAGDIPAGDRPRFERLRTGSGTFATLLRLRAASLARAASASAPYPVDACSVPLPVRRVPAAIPASD